MMLRLIVLAFTIALGNAAPIVDLPPVCADWCDNERHEGKAWKREGNGLSWHGLYTPRCEWDSCSGCSQCDANPLCAYWCYNYVGPVHSGCTLCSNWAPR